MAIHVDQSGEKDKLFEHWLDNVDGQFVDVKYYTWKLMAQIEFEGLLYPRPVSLGKLLAGLLFSSTQGYLMTYFVTIVSCACGPSTLGALSRPKYTLATRPVPQFSRISIA